MINFPEIPVSKIYNGRTTPEQNAQMKLIHGEKLTAADVNALQESVLFYEQAYPFLKNINLSALTENDKDEIVRFVNKMLNYNVIIQNNVRFKNVFRVSFVKEDFLENGKLRDTGFISYPPLPVVQKLRKYGRANSNDTTCLYCAFNPVIALLETKPKAGDRIIISQWLKDDDSPFVSFPIVNNNAVVNEGVIKGTKKFKERMAYNHPLFARTLDLLFEFLGSEFVKNVPIVNVNSYEYLYSAYFSDKVLKSTLKPVPHPTEPILNYDCVIYPSVAANHRTDNLAIRPESVKRLRPVLLREISATATDYENAVIYENDYPDNLPLPIKGEVLRTSTVINNGRIVWNDD